MDSKQLVTGQFSQIYSENILYFGKNYNYIVRSRNNQGTSNWSSVNEFTMPDKGTIVLDYALMIGQNKLSSNASQISRSEYTKDIGWNDGDSNYLVGNNLDGYNLAKSHIGSDNNITYESQWIKITINTSQNVGFTPNSLLYI